MAIWPGLCTYFFPGFYYENTKWTEKLKEVDGELLYTHQLDSTTDILLYLFDHLSIHLSIHSSILHFDAFQISSVHVFQNVSISATSVISKMLVALHRMLALWQCDSIHLNATSKKKDSPSLFNGKVTEMWSCWNVDKSKVILLWLYTYPVWFCLPSTSPSSFTCPPFIDIASFYPQNSPESLVSLLSHFTDGETETQRG